MHYLIGDGSIRHPRAAEGKLCSLDLLAPPMFCFSHPRTPFIIVFQLQGQLIDLGALRDPPGDRQYQSLLGLFDSK